jgi:hypothetical protein
MWQRKEAQKKLKHAGTFQGVSLLKKMYLPCIAYVGHPFEKRLLGLPSLSIFS